MSEGFWKVYYKCKLDIFRSGYSYYNLFYDLKDTGVDWEIAIDRFACMNELAGELIPDKNIKPGDIYVYFEKKNGKDQPILYIKVEENHDLPHTVKFNGNSIECLNVDSQYLPIIIEKLKEIDGVKNEPIIEKLEKRYEDFLRMNKLLEKDSYSSDEVLYLYLLHYGSGINVPGIEKRDINEDFRMMKVDEQVEMFLLAYGKKELIEKLSIDSRETIAKLAKMGYLVQLKNATGDIINDRDYIKSLLDEFFKCSRLVFYLPDQYQTDIDMLEYVLGKGYIFSISDLSAWNNSNQNFINSMNDTKFVLRFVRALAIASSSASGNFFPYNLLWGVPTDVLKSIKTSEDGTKEIQAMVRRLVKNAIDSRKLDKNSEE